MRWIDSQRKTGAPKNYGAPQSVKKLVFDRLAEVIKVVKTSNSTPKCMWILERGELRSKSKRLLERLIRQKLENFAVFLSREGLVGSIFAIFLFDVWGL